MPEIDLFSARRGTVTAPAGCGKTQLIADSLAEYEGARPVLVLTHTNAGKAALQARLERAGVPSQRYRVSTIDSWAIRAVAKFPGRSNCAPAVLRLDNPQRDYPAVRAACGRLLSGRHIDDVLSATYGRLIVDEYQDCTLPQHGIIDALADVLPTSVLGDPLQAIFGFREATVDWQDHVHARFPPLGGLATPWRWRNAQCERLGDWLLECRALLMAGRPINLRNAPPEVSWVQIDAARGAEQRLQAARVVPPARGDSVLIIGDSRNPAGQRALASQTPGATAVDAVDFRDLSAFAREFDPANGASLRVLATFCGEMMTNLGVPNLIQRIDTLARGAERRPADSHEVAALEFVRGPSARTALKVVQSFSRAPAVRVYRPEALRVLMGALQRAAAAAVPLHEAVAVAREQNRHRGRLVTRRAVGSTLLLKGLEADVAVLLDPTPMDNKHLYVALTRGAKRLVICSERPTLTPAS